MQAGLRKARDDLPLAEIAQRTGFTHQAHMNRVVTRLKGLSPGRLRSRGRASES
ncbi:helix-turn-helix domain-containing protein [Mesorhizobium sp.]|uniref:helix-turn-helix domain-containing protein n=1 Tax=Mesorhizobium sp. TaxID=1871066 RepID=UPI000F74CF37|nr:helix-turn-helix domain-containing protein [Mesorhizobium sp. M1B.F.Ca.ET.045.04.1.1]RWB18768.1 MAG: helix-turn-helix domain-containing protein [Mesorhizobium sp.]RWE01124.1 MAG: helix-turn-helix domain-containing protein [Mesorhizobium sp.]TIT98676.1 MAG: AraC family transcriptional regulator [Mesorhizobium sp.]